MQELLVQLRILKISLDELPQQESRSPVDFQQDVGFRLREFPFEKLEVLSVDPLATQDFVQELGIVLRPQTGQIIRQSFNLSLELDDAEVLAAQESPDRHQAADFQVSQSEFEGVRVDAVAAPPNTCFLFGFLQSGVHEIHGE